MAAERTLSILPAQPCKAAEGVSEDRRSIGIESIPQNNIRRRSLNRTQPLMNGFAMLENSPTKIDILANFELTQPHHRVRRRNVNFDYVARDDPIEDLTLKYIGQDTPENDKLKYCKDLEIVLTDGNSSDINALDLSDEIVVVLALLNKKESPIEILKFILNPGFCSKSRYSFKDIAYSTNKRRKWGGRNLSKLKKNLRSTTIEDRQNGLRIMAIEHELAEEINVKEIIKNILRIKKNGGSAHSTRQALTYISVRNRGISPLNETSPNIHLGEKTGISPLNETSLTYISVRKRGISPLNETSPNIHLGEKTGDQPTQRDKPSHLGEKTEDVPTQRDKPSHLGVIKRRQQMSRLSFAFSLQLVKMQQVSCKSIRFHHGALGYIKVLVHLIVQVVRQAAVIQIPEMGQYFQVDRKKSQLFKNFPLVRALDDNEASVSLGQVTKLAPDAEIQVFERYRSRQVAFQAEPFINVTVGPAVFGSREEVGMIHRDANYFWICAIPSGMLAMDSSIGTGWPPW
ncbi:uncharacterized protein TNCV_294141 [Trichonephila clavipes]|nr:uncharacterized protein TNCV_294141 [Trichonephila clavipes]